jgi:hypothetical protein
MSLLVQPSAFQKILALTVGIENTYTTRSTTRTLQKHAFTHLFDEVIRILSQNSEALYDHEWFLFDAHVSHLIRDELIRDSSLDNATQISNVVQRVELFGKKPLTQSRQWLLPTFSFDEVIKTADLLTRAYAGLDRERQHYYFTCVQNLFEQSVAFSQQDENNLKKFQTAFARVLAWELYVDSSQINKTRLTQIVHKMERASQKCFDEFPACIQPVVIHLKESSCIVKRENFLVLTQDPSNSNAQSTPLDWPPRAIDLRQLKTKEAEDAILHFLHGKSETFTAKVTAVNFADLYIFAMEHKLKHLKSFLQSILWAKMNKHPTPPINGFQWDVDFIPFLDAYLEVARRARTYQERVEFRFLGCENDLVEACTFYKMFAASEAEILSLINATIHDPEQHEIDKKLLYGYLTLHIDLNYQVAELVKKYIIPFLFQFDSEADNEFMLSAFEYFFLYHVFGKRNVKPTGELFKIEGLTSIRFLLENTDQIIRLQKAFQECNLGQSFDRVVFQLPTCSYNLDKNYGLSQDACYELTSSS